MKKAFTLIELLVVIAIIAILAAILFPVFAQAKEAAKKTQCLSGQKQVGTGMMMYLNDYDDTYPQSEYGYDGIQWYTSVSPYIKSDGTNVKMADGTDRFYGNGGVFKCPDFPNQVQGQHFGVHQDLMPSNWGAPTTITPPGTNSIIDAPADKIIITEKAVNNATNWSYPFFTVWQWFWTNNITSGGKIIRDGSERSTGQVPTDQGVYLNKDCSPSGGGSWECGGTIRYRHNDTANCTFSDGHAKSMKKGSIMWYKNIYINTGTYPSNQSWYPY